MVLDWEKKVNKHINLKIHKTHKHDHRHPEHEKPNRKKSARDGFDTQRKEPQSNPDDAAGVLHRAAPHRSINPPAESPDFGISGEKLMPGHGIIMSERRVESFCVI